MELVISSQTVHRDPVTQVQMGVYTQIREGTALKCLVLTGTGCALFLVPTVNSSDIPYGSCQGQFVWWEEQEQSSAWGAPASHLALPQLAEF